MIWTAICKQNSTKKQRAALYKLLNASEGTKERIRNLDREQTKDMIKLLIAAIPKIG